tara:strand:+ start:4125 stop:5198 length:1074 start_codon:yes stop_codon:yes gene_type:complete
MSPSVALSGPTSAPTSQPSAKLQSWLQTFATGKGKHWQDAAQQLMAQKEKAAAIYPQLRKLLESPSPKVRQLTVVILGTIGPKAASSAKSLMELWGDADTETRRYILFTLSTFGPKTPGLSGFIQKQSKTQDALILASLAGAIGRLQLPTKHALPILLRILKHNNGYTRQSAIRAIKKYGPKATAAIPVLIEHLADPRSFGRLLAAETLASIGPAARPHLLRALQYKKAKTRMNAAYALSLLQPYTQKTTKVLFQAILRETRPKVLSSMIQALGKMKTQAAPYANQLLPFLRHKDRGIQLKTIIALGHIQPQGPSFQAHLQANKTHPDFFIRSHIKQLLRRFPSTRPASSPSSRPTR